MVRKRLFRVGFLSVILLSATFLVGTNTASASEEPYSQVREQAANPPDAREPLAPERRGITVVTAHLGDAGDIFAVNPNGTVLYHNGTHDGYWDVDPVPDGRTTVVYTAADKVHDRSLCTPVGRENYCIRQMIERANLTTGDVTMLYSRVDPRYRASEWHDVDRINDSHYLVADMYADEVFVVDVQTGIVTWEWNVQNYLSLDTGGEYPDDWAHVNDVEVLDNGRFMVSLRNQDQVVFLDPGTGVIEEWTLGADDDHSVLYEQHNPDYIPTDRGGPAVLVADSERGRVVEYQRADGTWQRSWTWSDARLQWPRDADRLPNGHTLVTDTHGGRVLELDRQGDVVWTLDVPVAYEAERLGTGPESTGGPSATQIGIPSRSLDRETGDSDLVDNLRDGIIGLFPNKVVNGLTSVLPLWVGFYDLAALLVGIVTLVTWGLFEARWSRYTLRTPIAVE